MSSNIPVSIVVGGIGGIGSSISEQLIERGDIVYTVSKTDYIHDNNICCDIAYDCKPIFDRVERIDNIVFSHRYRGSDWDEMFNVTVKGVNNVIESVISKFNKGGSVVFISSNASKFILKEQSAEYHSSRSALDNLMRYYAVQYGTNEITFNSISPSTLIKSGNAEFFSKDNDVRKLIEEITPLGRMGKSRDVANLVDFLCSPKSSFITGNNFMLDGGLSLVGQEAIARNLFGLDHEK